MKDVDPRVFTRMLWKDGWTEGWKEGRTDGSVTISLRNFVGEGIIKIEGCCGHDHIVVGYITTYAIGSYHY